MSKMTYLCGGINGLSDADCTEWRERAKALLNTGTYDPMVRDYRGRENAALAENLVPRDLMDILKADFLLVNASRPSWGTAQELVYATQWKKCIIAFTNSDPEKASPWLRWHCDIVVETLDDAVTIINAYAAR